jgi:pilus assembly protein CpaB
VNGVKLIVIGAAAAAGLGAIALVQSEIGAARREGARSVQPAKAEPIAMSEVLVATGALERGHVLLSSDLSWREWPQSAVSDSLITRRRNPEALETFLGARVRQHIVEGEPILAGKIITVDSKGLMSALLREGMRAIAVKVAPETGAGGFILPGDYVDVILTREDQVEVELRDGSFGNKKFLFTDTLIQSVRVLAIDTEISSNDDPAIAPKRTATVEVTPRMAELLSLAERAGRITLSLRAFADVTPLSGELPLPTLAIDPNAIGSLKIDRLVGNPDMEGADEPPPPPAFDPAEIKDPGPKQVLVIRGTLKSQATIE